MLALANPFDIFNDPNFPFGNYNYRFETRKIAQPFTGDSLEMEVPGIKREDIQITLENNHIKVRHKNRNGEYETTFRNVGEVVGAKARLQDGILTITLERPEHTKPKTIKVEIE